MQRNRGHIIYRTVLLLTCCSCSILQRLSSTGSPLQSLCLGLLYVRLFLCYLSVFQELDLFSSFSWCANYNKERKSSPLQADSSWTCTRLFSRSTAHPREACSPTTPKVQSKHGLYCLSSLLCPSTSRLPSLHRNTSIDQLII